MPRCESTREPGTSVTAVLRDSASYVCRNWQSPKSLLCLSTIRALDLKRRNPVNGCYGAGLSGLTSRRQYTRPASTIVDIWASVPSGHWSRAAVPVTKWVGDDEHVT